MYTRGIQTRVLSTHSKGIVHLISIHKLFQENDCTNTF